MIKISICGNTVEEIQKHLPELSRLLTYYVQPQPGTKKVEEPKPVAVNLEKLEVPTAAAAIQSGELTLEDKKPLGRPPGKSGRKNAPGAGRPRRNEAEFFTNVPKKEEKPVSTAKQLDKLRKAVKKSPELESDLEEPEVAEPANKAIMDQFDAERKALEDGPEVLPSDLAELDGLLQEEELPSGGVKAPTWEDVNKVIVEMCNKRREAAEKDPRVKTGVTVLKEVLASFNVKKAGEVKAEHYSNFIQKVRSVM